NEPAKTRSESTSPQNNESRNPHAIIHVRAAQGEQKEKIPFEHGPKTHPKLRANPTTTPARLHVLRPGKPQPTLRTLQKYETNLNLYYLYVKNGGISGNLRQIFAPPLDSTRVWAGQERQNRVRRKHRKLKAANGWAIITL